MNPFFNPFAHFSRYVQIMRVLLKYGFGEYIKTFHPAYILAHLGIGRKKVVLRSLAQRLRLALEELGPTFIKLGQLASTRTDIIPEDFTRELAKLQDEVKPASFTEVKKIIEEEIGPIKEVFEQFNENPIGSASIAQVYPAIYKGQKVIVKVRRPRIEKIIETDIEILRMLVNIIEKNIPGVRERRLERLIDVFARTIRKELDFFNELNNAEKFRDLFRGDRRIYIPMVYQEISTNRVLIQEHIDGIKISDITKMKDNGIDPRVIAENGADIFLKQVLVAGFLHADPHPGNLFVKEGNVIVPIDFGMVGRLTPKTKDEISNLLMGVVETDPNRIARVLIKIGIIEDSVDFESLKEDIFYILDKFEGRNLAQISVAEFMNDINRVIRAYNIIIPQDLLYLGKALSQIEAIGRELHPGFDVLKSLKNFVVKNQIRMLSITESLRKGRWWLKDMIELLLNLPENINRLLDYNQRLHHLDKVEKKTDNRINWLLGGFGIMALSIFLFFVSNLPILKVLSILGLLFSFLVFITQIFLGMFAK